jgi:hypothetical protein
MKQSHDILSQNHRPCLIMIPFSVDTCQHSSVTDGLLRRMAHALSNQIPNLLTCVLLVELLRLMGF